MPLTRAQRAARLSAGISDSDSSLLDGNIPWSPSAVGIGADDATATDNVDHSPRHAAGPAAPSPMSVVDGPVHQAILPKRKLSTYAGLRPGKSSWRRRMELIVGVIHQLWQRCARAAGDRSLVLITLAISKFMAGVRWPLRAAREWIHARMAVGSLEHQRALKDPGDASRIAAQDEKLALRLKESSSARSSAYADASLRRRIPTPTSHALPSQSASTMSHFPPFVSPAPSKFSRKTLILDLDETLVHAQLLASWPPRAAVPAFSDASSKSPFRSSQIETLLVEVELPPSPTAPRLMRYQQKQIYRVMKRPHVDYFLAKAAAWFDVVIFTASLPAYADPVISRLDPTASLIRARYFRDKCIPSGQSYVKDVRTVQSDLRRVILVDNSPIAYQRQPANAIPVRTWAGGTEDGFEDGENDEELVDLLPLLDALRFVEDVRSVLGLRVIGEGDAATGTSRSGR